MLVRLLGPIEAADEALQLRVPGLRCKTLLALLAIQPGAMVSTERLIDEIWGARPPPTAMNSLANAVMRVRRVVGSDRIMTGSGSYGLVGGGDVEVDLSRFESLLTQASDASLDERLTALDDALHLWRGEVFGGAQSTPLIDDARRRVEGLRYDAQLALFETRLTLGQSVKQASVRPLVEAQPSNERAWAALGRAIHQAGDTGLALETVRLATDSLLSRGLGPGPALQEAEQHILAPEMPIPEIPQNTAQPASGQASAEAGHATAPIDRERTTPAPVGRRVEVGAIQAMIARAESGTATLTLVVGEAGIGKSTLVRDLLPETSDAETRWIFANCTSGGRGPMIELSLDLGVDVEQAWSGEVLPLIVDRLRAVSMERPTVVVIEDIHTTLGVSSLVSELVAGVKGHRVAVIATGRPGRNTDLLRQEMRGDASSTVELKGLTADDFAGLIDGLTSQDLNRLVAETGGNPLYLLTRAQSTADQSDLSNYVLSELSQLSPESRRIARLLSLHELPLTLGALASASGIADGLADHLQPLFESGLIAEWTDRTVQVQIRHQLISETVVAALSGSEILELHRAVRDAIAQPDHAADLTDPATLFLAAFHAWKASKSGDYEDAAIAAALCESAGDVAQAHGEWAQAADFYRRAVDSGAIDDRARSGRCRLGQAVALFRLGSTDAPGAFLDAARDASVRVDTALLADVALEWDRGTFTQATKVNDDRIRIIRRALRDNGLDRSRKARLLAGYASEMTFADRSSERFDIAEEALSLAEECDLPTLAHVLSHRQLTIASLDATEDRVRTADAFLDVAVELKDPHLLFQANFQRTGPAAIAGDLALVDDLLDEADDFAQHLSVRFYQWLVCHSKSALRLLQGDVEGAKALSRTAFDLARGSHQRGEATMIFGEQSCHIARVTGGLAGLVPGLAQMPGGIEDGFTVAALLATAGETETAAAIAPDDDGAIVASLPRNFMERPTLQNLAVLADALNRPALGKAVAKALERRPLDLGITGVAQPCGHHFAALAMRSSRDWQRVFDHHVSAVNFHDGAHHPLLALEAKRELVRSLQAAGIESVDRFDRDVLTAEVNRLSEELQVGGLSLN